MVLAEVDERERARCLWLLFRHPALRPWRAPQPMLLPPVPPPLLLLQR